MSLIDQASEKSVKTLKPVTEKASQVASKLVKNYINREGSRIKQPWSTLKKINEIIEKNS